MQKPYSSTNEWQKILERYSRTQQEMPNERPQDTGYDELAEQILALNNRNWIADQLKMH